MFGVPGGEHRKKYRVLNFCNFFGIPTTLFFFQKKKRQIQRGLKGGRKTPKMQQAAEGPKYRLGLKQCKVNLMEGPSSYFVA